MMGLQYLKYCLGIDNHLPRLGACEWKEIYEFCLRQSLVGIGFSGVEGVQEEQRPPKETMLQWFVLAKKIEQRNRLTDKRCVELQRMFAEAGFVSCILKGQGNATMYPNSLLRQSGDIDIWVRPKDAKCKRSDIRKIVEFLGTKCDIKKQVIGYHHVEFPVFNDVDVEVHWRPSWRSSPLYNYRLQQWGKRNAESMKTVELRNGAEQITVPSWEFNVVYLLQHMFLHIFQEGLGLRQVVDYYYLLRTSEKEIKENKEVIVKTLIHLGLNKFAGAVMYVMREVFALDERFMIMSVDERRGKFLLSEILRSGNFGKYDERNKSLHQKKGISRSIARAKRQLRFVRDYPHETLCAPFQIYHVLWRKLKFWKFE